MKIVIYYTPMLLLLMLVCLSCKEDHTDTLPVTSTKDAFEVKQIQITRKESTPEEQIGLFFR